MSTWTTAHGKVIPIKDMDDHHLLSSMRMLEREHRKITSYAMFPQLQGDIAQHFAEQGFFNVQDSAVDELYPVYGDLWQEAYNRNLL